MMETQDVGSFSACVWQPDKHATIDQAGRYHAFVWRELGKIGQPILSQGNPIEVIAASARDNILRDVAALKTADCGAKLLCHFHVIAPAEGVQREIAAASGDPGSAFCRSSAS